MKFSKYNIIHTTENQEHILFNSLWGSTFVISPSVKQAIESSNPTLLTEEENRLFIKYNALIPDEYNESCIYNHFYNKSRYGKKCLTATVVKVHGHPSLSGRRLDCTPGRRTSP